MRGDGEYRRRVNNDVELVLVFGAISTRVSFIDPRLPDPPIAILQLLPCNNREVY